MFSILAEPSFWISLFSVTLVQIALGADNLIIITIIEILCGLYTAALLVYLVATRWLDRCARPAPPSSSRRGAG